MINTTHPSNIEMFYKHHWYKNNEKQWKDFFHQNKTWKDFFEELPGNLAESLTEDILRSIIYKNLEITDPTKIYNEIPEILFKNIKNYMSGKIPIQFPQLVESFRSKWDELNKYVPDKRIVDHHGGQSNTRSSVIKRKAKRKAPAKRTAKKRVAKRTVKRKAPAKRRVAKRVAKKRVVKRKAPAKRRVAKRAAKKCIYRW